MLWQAALFVAGDLARLAWPGWLAAGAGVAAGAAALALLCGARSRAAAFCLLGFAVAETALQTHRAGLQQAEERLIADVEVLGIPQVDAEAVRFDAQVRAVREPSRAVQQVRLSWPGAAGRAIHAGEHWQLLLRLRPPRGLHNPGAVDTERNALRDHVQAFGGVIASPLNRRLAVAGPTLAGLRERLARRIVTGVADPASGALLAALAVGATGDVSREQWRVFNATGITHLVAISGMHVTLFAVVAMSLTRRIWALLARRGLRLRRDRVAAVAGIALATGYSLLAGFSVPTQRTLLMLGSFLLLRECARVVRPSTSLGLAALGVVVLDPFCTLSAGFWLSFLAVAAIVGYAGGRLLQEGAVRAAVTVQAAVFVALLPVTLAIFGSVSLAGLVVNIVAIPLFTFVLVPLALGATAVLLVAPAPLEGLLSDLLLRGGELAAAAFAPLLSRAADQAHALWFASPPPWWYGLAAVAILLVLPPWPWRLRLAGMLVLLPLLGAAERPAPRALRATVLDVGASTAVLVETMHHALLYGVGESFRSGGAVAERAVVPAAASRGLRSLDAVLLPRLDRDAGAGVTAVMARLPVQRLFAQAGRGGELPPEFQSCDGGGGWAWDGWQFDLLDAPGAGCALRVRGPGGSLLLADRLDAGAAQRLLARGLAPVDVLLVPRQGARAASSPQLLDGLGARLALASLSASLRSGESYAPLAQRYADAGIALVDTPTQGALTLRLEPGAPPQVSGSRAGRIGVWSLAPAAVR